MFPNRQQGITRLHFILQQSGTLLLLWLIYPCVNFLVYDGLLASDDYLRASFLLITASLLEYFTRDQDSRHLSGLNRQRLCAVSHRQTLFALATIFGTMVMSKDDSLSRIILAAFFSTYFIWIAWTNLFGYRMLHRALYRNGGKGMSKALLVGSPSALSRFCSQPSPPQPPGTDVLGYIPVGPGNAALKIGLPQLGQFGNLRKVCTDYGARALLLLGLQDRKDLVNPLTQISTELGLRTMWLDDVNATYGREYHAYHANNYSVVTHLQEPLEDPTNRLIKRAFDLICSSLGIILLLPPAILLAAILQRSSPGPLFYRHDRSGRNGATFQMLKFRTMQAEKSEEFEQAERNDPRVFRGGNFLRRTSIDELPQLLNVFLGHMSMVGPRPHPLPLDDRLATQSHRYRLRNLAKPGITGLAQSRGWRGETRRPNQVRNRIRLDVFYIQHWSLWLDLRIIAGTAWQIIKPPNSAF